MGIRVPQFRLLLIGVIACFGTNFHFGFQLMVLNPTKHIMDEFVNNSFETHFGYALTEQAYANLWSLILSLITIGAGFSLTIVPRVANRMGRKRGLYISQAGFLLATIPSVLAKTFNSWELLALGRFLYGISCGISGGLISLYLNELSPMENRGFMSSLTGLFIEIGFFTSSMVGLPFLLGTSESWPLIYVMEMIPTAVLLVCLPSFPESPKFLLAGGRVEEARDVLALFDDDPESVQATIDEEGLELKEAEEESHVSLREVLRDRDSRQGILLGVCISFLIPLSGILAINYFTTDLMTEYGFSRNTAASANLVITFCSILAGIGGLLAVDRYGRRPLLILGNVVMLLLNIVFLVTFETANVLEAAGSSFEAAPYIYLCGASVFMFAFSMGPGAIQWFMTAEMVSHRHRAHATALAQLTSYGSDFVAGFVFFPVYKLVGPFAFLLFILPLSIFTTYLYVRLPETKNRSLVEVQTALNSKTINICCFK